MTTETKKLQELSGTLQDIAFKRTKDDAEFVQVKLLVAGNRYPTTASAFKEDMVARFHNAKKGQRITLVVEESPGTYQDKGVTKKITYRNIEGIKAYTEGKPAPTAEMERDSKDLFPGSPEPRSPQRQAPPSDDRQDQIMLQNASNIVVQAYYNWSQDTQGESFDTYIERIAEYATWYRDVVYKANGLYPDASEKGEVADPEDVPF